MPQYIAIDLKSFYASVECVERGLDPLTTNLVVADESRTEKTICLAVSPSLKKYGIPGRARLFEVVQKVKQVNRSRKTGEPELSYIAAPPRMALYVEYSTRIYDIYLKYVAPEDIADVLDFASVDVSFISLTKVLVPARELLRDGGRMVCLIKPQFEAGREKVGKKGVVRDPKVHEEVIHKVIDFALENGFSVHNLSYSPIKGPEGNIEYLVYIEKNSESKKEETIDVEAIVEAAHTSLS